MEVNNLRVCWRCLCAIEHKEGTQTTFTHYWDGDEDNEFRCDWCDTDTETELYEIQ